MPTTTIATVVEAHHKLEYSASVTMVAQQMKNPLADTVISIAAKGEAMSATDLVGQVEYQYGEERSRRNVENPVAGTRRWLIRPPEIKSGQYIDDEDKFDMARDPTSQFVTAHTKAVIRGRMDRIVGVRKTAAGLYTVSDGGIMGNALEGKRPGTAGIALPGSQTIPVNATGMTLDKLRLAVLTLQQADFGLEDDDKLFCLIAPKQKDDLLAIAQASATPLNAFSIAQLESGKPTSLLGITWIISNRVPKNPAGNWMCPMWSKNNIVEGVWQDTNGDMWNDTSADNKPYVRVRARVDVVRLQDLGVVSIVCQA